MPNHTWDTNRVEALVEDSALLKRGKTLARPAKWEDAGQTGDLIWGLCSGSGKNSYQTAVDLSGPAYKCSCTSRTFPCKHALGLMLLHTNTGLGAQDAPDWAATWMQGRIERQQQAAQPADEQKAAKAAQRMQKRLEKMASGAREFQRWMEDSLRLGLAELATKDRESWKGLTGRLVDAQVPGMAQRVKDIQAGMSQPGWQDEALEQLGTLHLMAEALQREKSLPENLRTDLHTAAGINIRKEELASAAAVSDQWLVLGKREESQDRLRAQRTWLIGRTNKRLTVLIDYAFGQDGFEHNYVPGSSFEAELVYYPGSLPMRAFVKEEKQLFPEGFQPRPSDTLTEFLGGYAEALGTNPFLMEYPLLIGAVTPVKDRNLWKLKDREGQEIRINKKFKNRWEILAVSGGSAVTLFGEWNGREVYPLAMGTETGWSRV